MMPSDIPVYDAELLDSYQSLQEDFRLLASATEAAMIQARGALRLDAMLDEKGNRFGTTDVALKEIDDALDFIYSIRRAADELEKQAKEIAP